MEPLRKTATVEAPEAGPVAPPLETGPAPAPAAIDEPAPEPPALAPVVAAERIDAVDTLRGVAVLGILLMNIVDFALPGRGYADLRPAGGVHWSDLAYGATMLVFFEGTMRAIFSMLFGAGFLLLTGRAEARGAGLRTADIYTRRVLWLIAFGMIHSYFIWSGDILYHYGVVGLMLFPFRKASGRALLALGALLLVVPAVQGVYRAQQFQKTKAEGEAAERLEAQKKSLTDEQREARDAWRNLLKERRPDAKEVAKIVADYRGPWIKLFWRRVKETIQWESSGFYTFVFFDVAGMILVGMGLLKAGVLPNRCGPRVPIALMVVGYGIGLPLRAWMAYRLAASDFDLTIESTNGYWYSPGRISMALGHIGLVLTLLRANVAPRAFACLAAVGRMALTNYLLASVICTLLFNGYGLGLYDRLRLGQLPLVVLGVWALQLVISPIWLKYFRFGPMEWTWRSLTYWEPQPLRQGRPAPAPN